PRAGGRDGARPKPRDGARDGARAKSREGDREGKRARPAAGRKRSRIASRKAAERKRRRRNMWLITGVFMVLVLAGPGFAGYTLSGSLTPAADFAGPPGAQVIVQVHQGDTGTQVAGAMHDKGVVASREAFYQAAVRNSGMNSVQPGFYAIGVNSPAADAVA